MLISWELLILQVKTLKTFKNGDPFHKYLKKQKNNKTLQLFSQQNQQKYIMNNMEVTYILEKILVNGQKMKKTKEILMISHNG